MRAMICDDEKNTCTELEEILISYTSERGVQLDVDVFFSGDSMISYLREKEASDILFLDIEIPGADGVVVGDYIRSVLENEQVYIIYISSKEQYALRLFQNRPFDFLIRFIVLLEKATIALSIRIKETYFVFRMGISCIFKVLTERYRLS